MSRKAIVWLVILTLALGTLLAGCGPKKEEAKNPLTVKLYTYTNPRWYNAVGDKLAEAIKADLEKIGIKVEITSLAWKEYLDAVTKKGEGDMFLLGWMGDNGDPDNFLYMLLHSSQIKTTMNNAGYKNDAVDKLLEDAQKISNPAKRFEKYKVAQELIVRDAPWVFISHAEDMVATRSNIKGFQIHPTGWINLATVTKEGDKTLVFARGSDSISLDPAIPTDGESAKVMNNIYDNLVRYKAGSTDIEPALAETWETSADGLVWTFHLRKGVKFHDGTPFNAEAVKFNIERQLPPNDISNMPYAEFTFGMIDKVEAVDEHTVKITLKNPYAPFLSNLAMAISAPIISPAAAKKYGADYGQHPVGTGPFIFEKWDKEQQIVLRANKNYWGGAPAVDKVVFKVTKENSVRANELLTGSIDIMDGIDPNDVARLKADANIVLLHGPGMNINYLGMRTNRPPFDNPKLREAVSRAINRKALVEFLYQGTAILANGPLPPSMFGYHAGLKPYEYDVAKAKELLKEAGYYTTP